MGASRDWQKVDPDLRSHPAFAYLATLLSLGPMEAHGLLAGLWAMAYRQAEDGDLTRFKPGAIAAAIGYAGNARDMVAALVEAGFLERDGDERLLIHDWSSWGGALHEHRQKERLWQAAARDRHQPDVMPTSTRVSTSQRTVRVKSRPLTIVDSDESTSFAKFWGAYPNKQGKVVALRRWKAMRTVDRECAIEVASAMAAAVEHGHRERALCPHGSTFLNQRRWEEWFDDGVIVPPPGYGPPEAPPTTNPTTEDRRIACYLCHGEVSPDEMETAHWHEGKGWRHRDCTEDS
jgi:hypothetical protein